MNDHSTNLLLARFRADHDPEALGEFFDRTSPKLFPLALNLTGNSADAEDLLQATYLAMIESVERYDPARSAYGWVTGILTKQAKKQARRRRRAPDPRRLDAAPAASPARSAEDRELQGELRRAVEALPELYRSVVDLVLNHDLRPAQIADRLDRAPGAVRTQLHRGVAMLRKQLPKGAALPVALLAFDARGLAAVRADLLEAARTKTSAATAGSATTMTATLWIAAVLLVAGVAVTVVKLADPDEVPKPRGEDRLAALGSTGDATGSSGGELPTPIRTSRFEAPQLNANEPVEEAPATPEGIVTGVLHLPTDKGYVFATGEQTADEEDGDFHFESYELIVPEGAGIVSLSLDTHEIEGRRCSPDCYLRSIVSVDPEKMFWRERAGAKLYKGLPRTYVLKLAEGGYALLALQNFRLGHPAPVTELVIHYAFNPKAPVFREDVIGRPTKRGLIQDETAFLQDPHGDSLCREKEALITPMERQEARFRASEATAPGAPKVSGLLLQGPTSRVTLTGWNQWVTSFAFGHGVRCDQREYVDEVSFQLLGPRPLMMIRTATDDRGFVRDLGPMTLEAFTPTDARSSVGKEQLRLEEGHTYLVHSLDSHRDRMDLMQVLEVKKAAWVIFRWRPLSKEESGKVERLLHDPTRDIGNLVEIQMRGGAAGGNEHEAYFDGTVDFRLANPAKGPLDLTTPIKPEEFHQAWIRGGLIPPGKVWVVERIEFTALPKGDDNGPGGLRVTIANQDLVEIEQAGRQVSDTWTGRVVMRRGDLYTSCVAITNSTWCHVKIHGRLADE